MWLNEAGGPPQGEVLPAGRDPQARRRKRQAWTFATLVSLVLVTGVVALGQAMRWWTIGGEPTRAVRLPCPSETAADPEQVTLRIYNATDRFGLARTVAREYQARGFTVAAIGNDASGQVYQQSAIVRHGPAGKLAARSVAAQVAGPVSVQQDKRDTKSVDLVLGRGYKAMVPRPQASKAIAPVPTPAGCRRVTPPPPGSVQTTAPPAKPPSKPPSKPPARPTGAPASTPASVPARPTPTRSVIAPAPTTKPSVPGPTVIPTVP
jgi:hypothetical protein